MKLRDLFIFIFSIVGLFIFISLMYKNYLRAQELQIIKKEIYYDSLLMVEQIELKKKDSIIINQQKLLKDILGGHSTQINTIKNKVKTLEEYGEEQQ